MKRTGSPGWTKRMHSSMAGLSNGDVLIVCSMINLDVQGSWVKTASVVDDNILLRHPASDFGRVKQLHIHKKIIFSEAAFFK